MLAAGVAAQRQTPSAKVVRGSDDLQAALDHGGTIELEAGATFSAARFVVGKSGTTVRGHAASLRGTAGPALYIPPAINDVSISDLSLTSDAADAVVQCGDNGAAQTRPEQQPTDITFRNVTIPTHRGRRGFEINCAARIVDSKALDIYATTRVDSQALWVGNTCGPVTVIGGEYVAASENIMVGGDSVKLPCVQTDITFDGLTLTKPDTWRTDGIPVKNLAEVKAGRNVTLRNLRMGNVWKSAQDGWAFVITPKNGLLIDGVLIDNVTVDRCGGALQFLGKDYNSVTPAATRGVVVRNSTFDCRDGKSARGGRGIFALMSGGVLDVSVENVTFVGDGNAIVQSDTPAGSPQGPLTVRNSRMTVGTYGVTANGSNFGEPLPASSRYRGRELQAVLEGNVFALDGMSATGQKTFKRNFPKNTFVTRAELDALAAGRK